MKLTNINNAIKEVRDLFNEIRSNLSREEINKIRKNGLDYLFNEEDYYKPTEVKSAFDGDGVEEINMVN